MTYIKKILICVYVPILGNEYNVHIPIGKTVGTIKNAIMNIIGDLIGESFVYDMKLINKNTNKTYNDESLVSETNMQNGEKILLV